MATAATRPMTAAEFSQLDIDVPAELVRGEVIEMCRPGMKHGVICRNLVFSLEAWNRAANSKFFVIPEAGILTERNPDTVRGPDVYLVRRDRLPGGEIIDGFLELTPELCIEVVSPSDQWKDVITKVNEYLQAGVQEICVINPEEGQTYAYRPDAAPRTILHGDPLESTAIDGLKLPFEDVFRDVSNNT